VKKGTRIWQPISDEDREWFPQLIGMRWQDAVKDAAFQYRDDGFISQYLSPKVMRDFRMFTIELDYTTDDPTYVTEIHDDVGFKNLRRSLAKSKERINAVPQIAVIGADLDGDRILKLHYTEYEDRELAMDDAAEVVAYIDELWGYPCELKDHEG
jgi:spore cortex formation protein SpoVR/YcgB (stage V sporulation)